MNMLFQWTVLSLTPFSLLNEITKSVKHDQMGSLSTSVNHASDATRDTAMRACVCLFTLQLLHGARQRAC